MTLNNLDNPTVNNTLSLLDAKSLVRSLSSSVRMYSQIANPAFEVPTRFWALRPIEGQVSSKGSLRIPAG